MKIGIIGCGYVGQAAALQWKKTAGHEISATTRSVEKMSHLQTIVDHVYLLNASHPLQTFIEQQEVLLIAVAPGGTSDYIATYLETAKSVAEAVERAPHLQQIIYTSSTSVYGDHQGAWVNEMTPLIPANENGWILAETEKILLGCASECRKACVFRLGEIYGPGREIAQRLRRMQGRVFAGMGEAYTNLIHLEEIVRASDFALTHRLSGLYNLCEDYHLPRRELYDKLCREEGLPAIQWDPSQVNPHAGNKRVSNEKLKEAGFDFLARIAVER